jgi:hypothetical protein
MKPPTPNQSDELPGGVKLQPHMATIPLPLDIELRAHVSDGTAIVDMRFRSKEEAFNVISRLKQEIIDARKG